MSGSLPTEEFLNACEHKLRRAESVVRQPTQLQAELIELEELLRNEWPDAIMNIKETGMKKQYEEKIDGDSFCTFPEFRAPLSSAV